GDVAAVLRGGPREFKPGTGADIVLLEPPRHFELVEVRGVDLVERRVPRPSNIASVGGPVAVPGARQAPRLARHRNPGRDPDDSGDARQEPGRGSKECSPHT